jgi:starch phosphorylase
MTPESVAQAILENLHRRRGRPPELATCNDWYLSVAFTVRDHLLDRWIRTAQTLVRSDVKVVGYLSAEFLMGPHLGNALVNLGLESTVREACALLGQDLDVLIAHEEEPGLGNGGLGRLAACYLDSLSTLEVPAIGYGIRYEFGIFDQQIRDGGQVEITDHWLRNGNPWEIARPDTCYAVGFGGHTEAGQDEQGRYRVRWVPRNVVYGQAYDTPVLGYGVNTANLLRLWSAEARDSFDFQAFNLGEYWRAVEQKVHSENITKVLYPNDASPEGKRLRLEQQHFFVSCTMQDVLKLLLATGRPVETLPDKAAIQLNDTHPSVAVAELMRLLVDEHGLAWERAFELTRATFAYTNHTLLPEALETWPLPLFASLLPRHLEIIYEINRRFLDGVRRKRPGDESIASRVSLIDEHGEKAVRMAHLATVGSHAVNGVAALHSDLLRRDVLRDFAALEPAKFLNVTNGVTPRRWMALSNPRLAWLVGEHIGDAWLRDAERELPALEPLAEDAAFRAQWRAVKRSNKGQLAALVLERTGVTIDPESMFDVQVKRIHEYKRQHLNLLRVIALHDALLRGRTEGVAPRTVIFGGKAAPGYVMAKLLIRLVHGVAEVVNADPRTNELLRVVFVPDFNVKTGQHVYPAADLSEQISTAGKEASGTGNMKFALNGALTIGTLDGANVEIREAVGAEHFFLFGLTVDEVNARKAKGYDPRPYYEDDPCLRVAIDRIRSGEFSRGDRDLFRPLVDELLGRDEYLVLADFEAYLACQREVDAVWSDPERWTASSILNVARSGRFSSDRAVREYCEKIWAAKPVPVTLGEAGPGRR